MIVWQRKKVGPDDTLVFNGGEIPADVDSIIIYGKSTQNGDPTPESPVAISSVGSGGSITLTLTNSDGTTTVTETVANGLKGIRVLPGSYLVANGAYLMTSGYRFLKADQ